RRQSRAFVPDRNLCGVIGGESQCNPYQAVATVIGVFDRVRNQLIHDENSWNGAVRPNDNSRRSADLNLGARHRGSDVRAHVAKISNQIERLDLITAVQSVMCARDGCDAAACLPKLMADIVALGSGRL